MPQVDKNAQQLDLFTGQPDAPLTESQRRILETLERDYRRGGGGMEHHVLKDVLHMGWEELGRDLATLRDRRLVWHNHLDEWGPVHPGRRYSRYWLDDDCVNLLPLEEI